MKKDFNTAIVAGIAICSFVLQIACHAQSGSSHPGKNPPSALDRAAMQATGVEEMFVATKGDPPAKHASSDATTATDAAASSGAPSAAAATPNPAASVAPPVANDAVVKELEEMKARIAQLEAVLKARARTDDSTAAEKDANALRSAEGSNTAAGSSSSVVPGAQEAAAPAASTPAPPEISAQTTTKGEPFPGDWTWLNSNGHASDSPMATKYFTPEFRADANYTLDYNHPKDDTLGGSTETFRSDEWQLEQISIGGDIRINNVRGRILTMDGLFATTTVRNDASPSRGQWDLARRLQVCLRSVGRLSLGCASRPQRGCRHLRLLHRPVQLLQLRQLDLSAIVCFVQHTLVLQRSSHPVVPNEEAEDRALDHQRLAVLCTPQRQAWSGRSDSVASHAVSGLCLEQLRPR